MELNIDNISKSVEKYLETCKSQDKNGREKDSGISNSKLRDWFSYVTEIYNDIVIDRENKNWNKNVEKIKYLKIKYAYDIGRDNQDGKKNGLAKFSNDFSIIDKITKIDSREKFINFAKEFEAIVAFHKYYGGKK